MRAGTHRQKPTTGPAMSALVCLCALTACVDEPPAPPTWTWELPLGFAEPLVPADNPMSAAKVELGRHLFYDPRLSGQGSVSCASCHQQAFAFTNAKASATGAHGQETPRSPMSLANVAYASTLTWGNPLLTDLETQMLIPLFGEDPAELGTTGHWDEVEARLGADPYYQGAFAAAFPDNPDPISLLNVTRALACFERTLISGNSPYDRHLAGDATALSDAARRGLALFESSELGCATCHSGVLLTDAVAASGTQTFHHVGLDERAYLPPNRGVAEINGKIEDLGRFKTPTLRNIALTAPYMHDGSLATLAQVLDHFAAGGSGTDQQSARLRPFEMTDPQRDDLLAFLDSLTDEAFINDPQFFNPWTESMISRVTRSGGSTGE